MAVLHDGPGNVRKFLAGDKRLVEGNLDLIVHNPSFLITDKTQAFIKTGKHACFLKAGPSGAKKSARNHKQNFNIIE